MYFTQTGYGEALKWRHSTSSEKWDTHVLAFKISIAVSIKCAKI